MPMCDVCKCDRDHAWPPVASAYWIEQENNLALSGEALLMAIDDGCCFCALIKQAIDVFEAFDPVVWESNDTLHIELTCWDHERWDLRVDNVLSLSITGEGYVSNVPDEHQSLVLT
jgi:hypothetical protein